MSAKFPRGSRPIFSHPPMRQYISILKLSNDVVSIKYFTVFSLKIFLGCISTPKVSEHVQETMLGPG